MRKWIGMLICGVIFTMGTAVLVATEVAVYVDKKIAAEKTEFDGRLDTLGSLCTENAARLDAVDIEIAALGAVDATLWQFKAATEQYQNRAFEVEKLIGTRFANIDQLFTRFHPAECKKLMEAQQAAAEKATDGGAK